MSISEIPNFLISGFSDIRMPPCFLEIRISIFPKIRISENSDVRISENADCVKSDFPDYRKSEFPKIQNSGFTNFRKFGYADFGISEYPNYNYLFHTTLSVFPIIFKADFPNDITISEDMHCVALFTLFKGTVSGHALLDSSGSRYFIFVSLSVFF